MGKQLGSAGIGSRKNDGVLAILGIGMRRIAFRTRISIAEGPQVAIGMSAQIGKTDFQPVGAAREVGRWELPDGNVTHLRKRIGAVGVGDDERHAEGTGVHILDDRILSS